MSDIEYVILIIALLLYSGILTAGLAKAHHDLQKQAKMIQNVIDEVKAHITKEEI
jgi:hypothetical protein